MQSTAQEKLVLIYITGERGEFDANPRAVLTRRGEHLVFCSGAKDPVKLCLGDSFEPKEHLLVPGKFFRSEVVESRGVRQEPVFYIKDDQTYDDDPCVIIE